MKYLARGIWRVLSAKRRVQVVNLIFLSLLTSLFEIFSIGAAVPFLAVITNPEMLAESGKIGQFALPAELLHPEKAVLVLTLVFAGGCVSTGLMRVALLRLQIHLSQGIGADFGARVFSSIIERPYARHLERNSSEAISVLTSKISNSVNRTIMPLLTIISAALLIVMIFSFLLFLSPLIALFVSSGFALIYSAVTIFTRRKLARNSLQVQKNSTQLVQLVQSAMEGFRELLMYQKQSQYVNNFVELDGHYRRALASSFFMASFPRHVIEPLAVVLILWVAYFSHSSSNTEAILPILGAFTLAAQRILPIAQQVYGGWTLIKSDKASMNEVLELLPIDSALFHDELIVPDNWAKIELKEVTFAYSVSRPFVFRETSFSILRGEKVGISGKSGSGKSTFLDLVMGIMPPQQGSLRVDSLIINESNVRSWRSKISHVPQSIFLADVSVKEAIAFGVPVSEIDMERVELAASVVGLTKFISSLPLGYSEMLGERGARISGGQRQRIGIARALYRQTPIVVLDEATNALDFESESLLYDSVIEAFPSLTLIVVSHRHEALKYLDRIITIS